MVCAKGLCQQTTISKQTNNEKKKKKKKKKLNTYNFHITSNRSEQEDGLLTTIIYVNFIEKMQSTNLFKAVKLEQEKLSDKSQNNKRKDNNRISHVIDDMISILFTFVLRHTRLLFE